MSTKTSPTPVRAPAPKKASKRRTAKVVWRRPDAGTPAKPVPARPEQDGTL